MRQHSLKLRTMHPLELEKEIKADLGIINNIDFDPTGIAVVSLIKLPQELELDTDAIAACGLQVSSLRIMDCGFVEFMAFGIFLERINQVMEVATIFKDYLASVNLCNESASIAIANTLYGACWGAQLRTLPRVFLDPESAALTDVSKISSCFDVYEGESASQRMPCIQSSNNYRTLEPEKSLRLEPI